MTLVDLKDFVGRTHDKTCFYSGEPLPIDYRELEWCTCDPFMHRHRDMMLGLYNYRRNILTVLYQDEYWVNREGFVLQLTDLSLRYKKNILAFLERRAETLHLAHQRVAAAIIDQMSEASQDAAGRKLDEEFEMRPTTWLYHTPFMLRLEQLIREGQDGLID